MFRNIKITVKQYSKYIPTTRLPITMTMRKTVRHMGCPATFMQSHMVSIHSPHSTRNTIRKEWKKSIMCQRG